MGVGVCVHSTHQTSSYQTDPYFFLITHFTLIIFFKDLFAVGESFSIVSSYSVRRTGHRVSDDLFAVTMGIPYLDHFTQDIVPGFLLVHQDRKSTRLNSSHVKISYAVF